MSLLAARTLASTCRRPDAVRSAVPRLNSARPARPTAVRELVASRRHAEDIKTNVVNRSEAAGAETTALGFQMEPFCGCNCYYLLEMISSGEDQMVQDTLKGIQDMGFTVIRMWGFNDDGGNALQKERGKLDPQILEKFDKLFDMLADINAASSGKPKMKFMVTLTNHLKDYGGHLKYAEWFNLNCCNGKPCPRRFYDSDKAKDAFDQYVTELIHHCKNKKTNSGTPFFDLIHSWDICNEPRSNNEPEAVTAWVDRVAKKIKILDPTHPVTVGIEGFYGPSKSELLSSNPYGGDEGVDFVAIGNIPEIDFMSIHLWPDQWRGTGPQDWIDWSIDWIQSHMDACRHSLQKPKPLCLQEYDLSIYKVKPEHRKQLLEKVEALHRHNLTKGDGILAGSMVWMIADQSYVNKVGDQWGHFIVPDRPADHEWVDVLKRHCQDVLDAIGRKPLPS